MKYQFPVFRTETPKAKPDENTLGFGNYFTDHMFLMEYDDANGWHNGRVVPFAPLSLNPAAAVLHYSQQMFEGLKAYRRADGKILLFRPDMNAKRTSLTCDRMCIPLMDEQLFVDAICAVVEADRDWVPSLPGTSLYIRPFIYADEPFLGVHAAQHYQFVVILSPVGPYYASSSGGITPTNIYVEREYVRAAPGGTGYAKVGANYAGSLKAQVKASEKDCEQVLWLDSNEHKYVEEIGTSNAFFMIGDEIITAPLNGSILPGITRDSVIALLKKWGMNIQERRLSIDAVFAAANDGTLGEAFATGTAAVISPVGSLVFDDTRLQLGDGSVGALSQKLYDTLYGIQTGTVTDDMGWTVEV